MDSQTNLGEDLVRIHKVITRALTVSLENIQNTELPERHRPGLAAYVRCLTILLHAHHSGEDELAFPFWKTRMPEGPFDKLIDQHRQMVAYLESLERWLSMGPDAWQVKALDDVHQGLTGLQNLWTAHIALEEETVGPEQSRRYLSPTENEQLSKQLSEHGQAHSQPGELVMPFVVFNLPVHDREIFMKLLPPIVVNELIPVVWKAAWEPMTPFLLL